jgi:DNA-binding NtrC family response regulator
MPNDRAHILIVDDDAENGKFLEERLAGAGCRTTWFKDPRLALQKFRSGTYQVGILDLKMPKMNGVDLFKQLHEKDPNIGLIILTGYPTVDTVLTTLKTGAYDYVKKPYKIDALKKIVTRLLEEKGFFLNAEEIVNQRVGQRIKEFRGQKQWTLTKLALSAGLSKSLISQLENGKNSASLATLSKIARCLTIRVSDLVQDL